MNEETETTQQFDRQPEAVPQNPMQASIRGYRQFDQGTSDFINRVKKLGDEVERVLNEADERGDNPRAVGLARTQFQQGAMWLIRAAAKPQGLF